MRLSTSTCIYFNRPDGSKADYNDCINLCADAGYRVMDMNFHDACVFKTPFVYDGWKNWLGKIKKTADDRGIVFSQAHSHFYNYTENKIENEQLEVLVRRCIEGASFLGIPWVVIHAASAFGSVNFYKDSKKAGIEYFSSLLEYAAKYNVGLAIENLWEMNIAPQRRYTSNAEEVVDLVDSLDFPNVGICWDVEHSSIMKQDLKAALAVVGDRLKATHISDYIDIKNDHILPFTGLSNWDAIMDAFASVSYDGDFTYEVHRMTLPLPEELVPTSLKHSVVTGEYLINEILKRRNNNG